MSLSTPAFALVRAPIAPMLAEPRVSSAQVSQALFGHAPTVVASDGDWHRLRTLDGYEGWTHGGYLAVLAAPLPLALSAATVRALGGSEATTSAEANGVAKLASTYDADRLAALLADDAVPRVSMGCTVLAGDRKMRLPVGAWVHGPQTLLEGEAVPLDAMIERFPRDPDMIARSGARLFEGTSYQWGGVTPWGADCSGFVQTVFGMHGVALPRDAWQQASAGLDVGSDVEALEPADLLFFSDRDDRRVTHVGMALGGGRMAHLALARGGWAADDLTDPGDPYCVRLRERFTGARRVL